MTADRAKKLIEFARKTGGPAFPMLIDRSEQPWPELALHTEGLTVRDYFAAAALTALGAMASTMTRQGANDAYAFHWTREEVAAFAYDLADAMIAERAKSAEQPQAASEERSK